MLVYRAGMPRSALLHGPAFHAQAEHPGREQITQASNNDCLCWPSVSRLWQRRRRRRGQVGS